MAGIRWTTQAADDLDAIAEYISNDSPYHGRLFVLRILAAIERLSIFPKRGRKVPESPDLDIREIILGN